MTITTLRPTAHLYSSGSFSFTGAATDWQCTSDSADASYMRATTDKAYTVMDLGALGALTGTQRIKSAQIRIRNAADTAPQAYQGTEVKLMDQTNHSLVCGNYTSWRQVTSIVTWPGPVTYKAPGGAAWTLAKVNNLQLVVQWFKPGWGTVLYQRVHELSVDIDINEQPTLAAPTVTNFTDNARPTVAWVYSDTDGDPQTHFWLKVFDSATYGSAGFDPETATAAYDTGDTVGDTQSFTLDKDLQNGVTYKAYVKLGQLWQPDNTTWFSAYGISSAFTVTFTAPYTPTLTAQVISDGQSYRTSLALVAPMNLLVGDNADFEGGGIGGWVADTNMSAPTNSVTDAAHGTHSLQLSSTAGGDMIARCGLDFLGDPAVNGGVQYTALASFHAATAGRSCQVGIRWLDVTQATISTSFGSSITDVTTAGVYTQAFFTGNAPGNAVYALAVVKVLATGGAAEIHRVDKVSIARGASTSWVPGMSSFAHTTYIERGERLDPSRGPVENWAHPDVGTAGSVRRTQGYGFTWDTTKDLLQWEWLDKLIPGGGPPGMLHWQPRDPASSVTSLRLGAWSYYPETEWNFPVIVGQTQVGSFWAWVATGTLNVAPKIEWLGDAGGAPLSTTTGTSVQLTTTPKQISVSGTTPASASSAKIVVQNDAGTNSADIYLTRIGWGLGATPVDDKPPLGGNLVWTPLRFGEEGLGPVFAFGYGTAQQFRYNDYEMTPGRPVLYRARLSVTVNNVTVISPNSAYVPIYGTPPTRTMLRSVTDPTLACVVHRSEGRSVGGPSSTFTRSQDAAIFHPLGRDGGPVQVVDWASGEDGQLDAVTTSEKQAQRLDALVSSDGVLQVQWARGGLSYILITGQSQDEDMFQVPRVDVDDTVVNPYMAYRVWRIGYVETTAP